MSIDVVERDIVRVSTQKQHEPYTVGEVPHSVSASSPLDAWERR